MTGGLDQGADGDGFTLIDPHSLTAGQRLTGSEIPAWDREERNANYRRKGYA
jgi:hypothetical protein